MTRSISPHCRCVDCNRRSRRIRCDLPLITTLTGIGKDGIKALRVSPDAFFHAALHLAYFKKFNRVPSVQNLADMRGVRFGSITRYLSTTPKMADFLEHRTKARLQAALRAHTDRVAVIKSGINPLLLCLLLSVFVDRFQVFGGNRVVQAFHLRSLYQAYFGRISWASNISTDPEITVLGRFGMLFKFARDGCLAGHYLLLPDRITIGFLSNKQGFLQSWPIGDALNDAIAELTAIFRPKRGPAPGHADRSKAQACPHRPAAQSSLS